MKKAPNTHRLSWATFDRKIGRRQDAHMDFPTKEEAERHRDYVLATVPEAVVCVTAIVRKERAVRAEKVGEGHPEWQGHRRVTE